MTERAERLHTYIFYDFTISKADTVFIQRHCAEIISREVSGYTDLTPDHVETDFAQFPMVTVLQQEGHLSLSCSCLAAPEQLCAHQARVLYHIISTDVLRVFFDAVLRQQQLQRFAATYGLREEPQPDRFFNILYRDEQVVIQPKIAGLYAVTPEATRYWKEQLLSAAPATAGIVIPAVAASEETVLFVVLKQHKYYKHLLLELYEATTTKAGKLRNPFTAVAPMDHLWKVEHQDAVKFFTGITRFQQPVREQKVAADIAALKAVVKNPLALPFYAHDAAVSESITAAAVTPVTVGAMVQELQLIVHKKGVFYDISGELVLDGQVYALKDLTIRFDYFIVINEVLHLAGNLHFLKVIAFFKQHHSQLIIHESQFKAFQQEVLAQLEDRVHILYTYLKPATPEQAAEQGFDGPPEKLLYLSDTDNYVLLNPVMKYGEVEIPILTRRQVYATDSKGKVFAVERDSAAEDAFASLLMQQHPHLYDQVDGDLPYLSLHKKRFLEEEWFLNAFATWREQGITIFGFNDLKGNRLNAYKIEVTIRVTSGINWFDAIIKARFGKKKASLQQLQKSVRNKNKYVQLDDGTLGILPEEWMTQFAAYFDAGDISGELLTIPKINFSAVSKLFAEEMLDDEVKQELTMYMHRFSGFESINEIPVPTTLQTTLRHYQWQGLNWLNFLDDFNFGGCLADDMGLGKSVQIIAFILSQREKVAQNTNLIVVPTSLIFNWQDELQKFAPSIRVHTIYGAGRTRDIGGLDAYEVVLTSYGTLVSDIEVLKQYTFNYVFADESQQIKNPDSQRYQAMRLLKSRNRIAITGTPLENNTFDLYGQLSFTCPGLLGNKQYFRDIYAIPIDKFANRKRALELQQKINPFILRRTKQQVATELPEKTEMVLHCPMDEAQRKVYDASEKELRDYLERRLEDDEMVQTTSMHVLKGLTRLRQICDSPNLLAEEKLYGNSSSKITVLLEQIESKAPHHKILVFSQFVSMLQLIRQELQQRSIPFAYLTGGTRNREAAVDDFQEDAATRVFLISLKAGGVGLNLTAADYVYLVDPWWNPAVENQAIDRCYRIGQQKKVVAVRLICPDTVEEKILTLQERKKELTEHLVQTDVSLYKQLTKADLLGLLSSAPL